MLLFLKQIVNNRYSNWKIGSQDTNMCTI